MRREVGSRVDSLTDDAGLAPAAVGALEGGAHHLQRFKVRGVSEVGLN